MEKMTKETFKFGFNWKTGPWYIYKAEEEPMKNYQSIDDKVSGFIQENKTDVMCPVR